MASWVYIFSKFTPEALLFEALIICTLCASYAAFWVLRKRKYGVLGQDTPAYAVKSYLSQLILDAEQMRIQLFGLLAGTGVDPNAMAALRAASAGANAGAGVAVSAMASISAAALAADPELAAKLSALEAKMAEQAKAMETISSDKVRIEKELIEVRSKGGGGGAAAAGDDGSAAKIKALEAKLAEYSVIEDDLANLKRLQQENTQLKVQLGSGKAAPVAAAAVEVPTLEAPSAPVEEVAAAVAEEAAPIEETPTEAPSAAAPEEAAAAAAVAATDAAIAEAAAKPTEVAEPVAAATADPGFEGLVDQVEQSLVQPNSAQAGAGATTTDPAAGEVKVTAAPSGGSPGAEKTDADLVAEFEKMLNS